MSTKCQGHWLIFVQSHSDLYFQIYSQAAGHIQVNFHIEPLWSVGTKIYSNVGGYMAKMMWLNLLKIFFCGKKKKAQNDNC